MGGKYLSRKLIHYEHMCVYYLFIDYYPGESINLFATDQHVRVYSVLPLNEFRLIGRYVSYLCRMTMELKQTEVIVEIDILNTNLRIISKFTGTGLPHDVLWQV